MNPAWISQCLPLSGCAVRIEEEDGEAVVVLRRESLAVVRSAADVVRAARQACARRLRAARERERCWRQRARDRCSDRLSHELAELRNEALTDATRISIALNDEREHLLEAAETLLVEIAQQAARRLLIDLPADQLARSSARLLRDEWRASRGQGESQLRAHPDDVEALTDIAADAGWTVAPDVVLARGDCVLTHPAGSLHASYGDNVRALFGALLGALPRASSTAALPVPSPPLTSPPVPSETLS